MFTWSRITHIGGFGLLVLLTASSCVTQGTSANKTERDWVMLNQSLILSDAEIKALEPQALRGSAEAAMRLCNFYDFIRMDHGEAMFWAQIAAENGGHINEYNYGFMLHQDPNPRNRRRARFWLERAALGGDKESVDLLKELGE